jgi:DNA-binding LacI/PurR family transcriptional regulator
MIIQAVQSALAPNQRIVLGNASSIDWSEAVTAEATFLDQIARDPGIEGLITAYMGAEENFASLERVRAAGIPIVFIDHLPPTGFEADYVGVNNALAAERIVRHLAREGHKVIAHVSNYEVVSTIVERRTGYRRAVAKLNLAFAEELIQRDPGPSGDDASEGCEEIVSKLLGLSNPPTAIVAASDVIAYRVIAALRRLGKTVPEDISVTGFDGVDRWMPTQPFLTTICQPFEEIGAHAVELLGHRSSAHGGNEYRHVILEARLSVQGSTRPPCRANPV